MKKDYTLLELFGCMVLGLMVSIPLSFYNAWVVLKIIDWFKIPIHLTLLQMFAVNQLAGLYFYTEAKEEETFTALIAKMFSRAVLVFFVLLIMYIIYSITL